MIEHAMRSAIAYNQWANHRLWDCINALPDEDAFLRDMGYSLGSVRNQLVHMMSVDARWLARLQDRVPPTHLKAEDFATRQQVWTTWQQVEADYSAYSASLTETHLAQIITFDLPHRGGQKENPRWQILQHVINHATDHRAQTLATLHSLGAPTVEQDMMFFYWE